ncbi:MAG: HlyD family secretion protein [Bdellovibrionaceae bacterium]|nr:HlyD family secretion protein [Pseudobdellovibrionaceae bacterium]MBX3032480.1 HlyD family secretion protein [Pseudobdellovibrionaceae bacterium]
MRSDSSSSGPSPIASAPAGSLRETPVRAGFRLTLRQKILAGLAAVALVFLGARTARHLMFFESTDDAFVKAHIHTVSARIPGTVQEVLVDDNQIVKKGDVLVKLDPRDYEVQIKAAQAGYSKTHKDLKRFQGFSALDPTERPVFDQYQANALIAEADLTRAQLQYEYTNITAAADGKIGKRGVEVGEQIQPGQALMALVQPHPWIEANFKENQVAKIRPGQDVEIEIDAIPGHVFHGRIDSIAPGSGSTFSLLPPDNATGNFTKIVQRIPVKILIEEESSRDFTDRLVSGMSAEVTVRVR